ncbi:Uncharacterised protein g7807 [Pycnogonum litorale]
MKCIRSYKVLIAVAWFVLLFIQCSHTGRVFGKRRRYDLPSGTKKLLDSPLKTTFSCRGLPYGYYADMENDCRIFHLCVPPIRLPPGYRQSNMVFMYSFMCASQTIFDQSKLTCRYPNDAIECRHSSQHLGSNRKFFRVLTPKLSTNPGNAHQLEGHSSNKHFTFDTTVGPSSIPVRVYMRGPTRKYRIPVLRFKATTPMAKVTSKGATEETTTPTVTSKGATEETTTVSPFRDVKNVTSTESTDSFEGHGMVGNDEAPGSEDTFGQLEEASGNSDYQVNLDIKTPSSRYQYLQKLVKVGHTGGKSIDGGSKDYANAQSNPKILEVKSWIDDGSLKAYKKEKMRTKPGNSKMSKVKAKVVDGIASEEGIRWRPQKLDEDLTSSLLLPMESEELEEFDWKIESHNVSDAEIDGESSAHSHISRPSDNQLQFEVYHRYFPWHPSKNDSFGIGSTDGSSKDRRQTTLPPIRSTTLRNPENIFDGLSSDDEKSSQRSDDGKVAEVHQRLLQNDTNMTGDAERPQERDGNDLDDLETLNRQPLKSQIGVEYRNDKQEVNNLQNNMLDQLGANRPTDEPKTSNRPTVTQQSLGDELNHTKSIGNGTELKSFTPASLKLLSTGSNEYGSNHNMSMFYAAFNPLLNSLKNVASVIKQEYMEIMSHRQLNVTVENATQFLDGRQ